jgi:hypothetical protein
MSAFSSLDGEKALMIMEGHRDCPAAGRPDA